MASLAHAAARRRVLGAVARHEAARPFALIGLALVAALGYRAYGALAPAGGGRPAPQPVVALTLALLAPYLAACWLVLAAPTPRGAAWRRAEWAAIAGGALLFRALVLPVPPLLSPDAYRYVWDARLSAHGLSPYLHGPSWPGFARLRDAALYPLVPWKGVPTIYPPGAQLLYRLAYAAAPSSVWAIKAEMTLWDLLAALALALLLARRGLDPRRVVIYLWAPLTIVEFALSGHEDAAAIALILLALLADGATFRGSRALTGVLIGCATLVKLYPLLLLVALARRRDWTLVGAAALTVAAGYAPYWRDGLAALGFLSSYLTQVQVSYGGALLLLRWIGGWMGLGAGAVRALGALGAAGGVVGVAWLRLGDGRRLKPRLGACGHEVRRRGLGRGKRAGTGTARAGTGTARAEERRGVPATGQTPSGRLLPIEERLGIGRIGRGAAAGAAAGPAIGPVAAACALIALWLLFSPHVFPWYATALLPFCALLSARPAGRVTRAAAAGLWSFAALVPLAYVAYASRPLAWLYPALYLAASALALGLLVRGRRHGGSLPEPAYQAPAAADDAAAVPT